MKKDIKIRDLRKSDQFKIDDAYLNGYARLCGVYATAVYNSLSRHADFNTQQCWPSIDLISEQHNISRPSVIKGIKELEKWGIIQITKEKDKKTKRQLPNIYVLVDKSEWKPKPSRVNDIDSEIDKSRVNVATKPSQPHFKSRVNDIDCKDTHIKDNTVEGVAIVPIADDINKFINLFKEISPTNYKDWFANKTERSSAEKLLKLYPITQWENVLKKGLPLLHSKPYTPQNCKAYKPSELLRNLDRIKDKLRELKNQKEENKPKILR